MLKIVAPNAFEDLMENAAVCYMVKRVYYGNGAEKNSLTHL